MNDSCAPSILPRICLAPTSSSHFQDLINRNSLTLSSCPTMIKSAPWSGFIYTIHPRYKVHNTILLNYLGLDFVQMQCKVIVKDYNTRNKTIQHYILSL